MLLSYSHHSSPTGLQDVLDKLATFAAAQGWTVDFQTNKDWTDTGGGVYDWTTGTHYFLELSSNGWGSQDLTYRFYQDYIDANEDVLYYCAIEPGAGSYDSIATLPHLQDYWNNSVGYQVTYNKMSCPNTTTTDLWIVGNDKFIAVHWRVATTYIISFAFGTIDLIPEVQDTTELAFFWGGCSYRTITPDRYWSAADTYPTWWFCPYGYQIYVFPYDGIKWFWYKSQAFSNSPNHVGVQNLRYNTSDCDVDPGAITGDKIYFNTYPYCCAYNAFTQKRSLVRPTFYLHDLKSDDTFCAIGHLPVYFLNVSGLIPGEIIVAGTEEYICFPAFFTNNVYGVAYRVV